VAEVAEVIGSNTEYGVKMILAHDTRDNAFIPTTGHSIEVGFEQVFGDFQYPIATLDARQYFTVYRRGDLSGAHVLSVGGSVGVAGDDTPVYANFYAGGYSTLRGFAFRGASPKNGDVIVGGEFQLVGTVEYMFPITADNLLRGVVFCDAGTIEEQVEIKTDALRVAPGVGLRIAHPGLGPAPIALDLAFPVMHEEGDSIRNFIFFIGVRH
jgi:outer membrane protein insertion porin family